MFHFLLGALLVAFVCTPAIARGQTQSTSGDLEGVLSDATGARLISATVDVVNQETGFRRTVSPDAEGRYVVRALPVGVYRVSVSATGFETQEIPDVTVTLGVPVVLDVTLRVMGQQVTVVVRPELAADDPQRPGIGRNIPRGEFDRLPVDSRNFLSFSLLTPSSAPDRTPQQGATRTSGLTFSGQRARSNNIVVDGLDNNDQVVGSVRAAFSQEAVQEYQVLANGFSAEFGRASGGVVNIVTRSGTNTVRGSAFMYFRDDALSARNYFERFTPDGLPASVGKAPFERYQYGATFGGPLRRDRTFIFGSIERLSANASNLVTIDSVTLVPDPRTPGATLGTPASIIRAAGFPIDTGHVPFRLRSTQWIVKLDHVLGTEDRLALRANGASELNENIEPFGGLVARSRAASLDNSDLMVAGSYTTARGTHLVNEARLLMARRSQDVRALDPACDGICDREDEGGPTAEVAGTAAFGRQRFTPTPRDDTRYQLVDTLSYSRGTHVIRTGVDTNVIVGRRQALPLHFGGRYIFTALPAIPGVLPVALSPIQALALGLPAAYVQGYGNSSFTYNVGDFAAFVEDVWSPGARLSIRAGIRYQRQFWPDVSYQVPGVTNPYGFPPDTNDIAPRVAVSWTPASPGFVIRGGYGMYYDNVITSIAGIARNITGQPDGIRTLALPAPAAFAAWAAPGHRISESTARVLAGGSFPSVVIAIDPGLRTSYAHHVFAGIDRNLFGAGTLSVTATYARGFKQIGTVDYNPVVPALGPGRRPEDIGGVAGTSASVLQYTSFGETWYRALTAAIETRPVHGVTIRASYTLSDAEDTATDFQTAFLPQNNGAGRDPSEPEGLPRGFVPGDERGPAVQDQRHRLVFTALTELPYGFVAAAVANAASGWPYNVLAGVDLNGDRDGGAFPSDRARRVPSDPSSALPRNSGRLPSQATLDVRVSRPMQAGRIAVEPTFEMFNLFNRTNFVDVQNVFGPGAYPDQPAATYGQFTQAGGARQVQLSVRLLF